MSESVLKRAEYLLDQAKTAKDGLSKRYVILARKLAMRTRTRLPPELNRRFCGKCSAYLKPGENLSVRLHGGKLVYYCKECGSHRRMPLHNK